MNYDRIFEVLQPLADAANGWDAGAPVPADWTRLRAYTFDQHGHVRDIESRPGITVGDLRRARALLEELRAELVKHARIGRRLLKEIME